MVADGFQERIQRDVGRSVLTYAVEFIIFPLQLSVLRDSGAQPEPHDLFRLHQNLHQNYYAKEK